MVALSSVVEVGFGDEKDQNDEDLSERENTLAGGRELGGVNLM